MAGLGLTFSTGALLSMKAVTTTHDIIQRVKEGQSDAFTELFTKYRARLAVLIHFRLGSELNRIVDVDDILQETLIRAYRDIDKFEYRGSGSLMSWLTRIADHVIADLARSGGRQKRAAELVRFRSEGNPAGPDPVDYATPSRIFRENEDLTRLLEKLHLLPDDYRNVILMAKVEGLTSREIADRLGKPPEKVSLLLHRAIKRLRKLLDSPSD
ncbi:MAG TPA: RNA polymerase sigma factor [Blastocatellia bacterium]